MLFLVNKFVECCLGQIQTLRSRMVTQWFSLTAFPLPLVAEESLVRLGTAPPSGALGPFTPMCFLSNF